MGAVVELTTAYGKADLGAVVLKTEVGTDMALLNEIAKQFYEQATLNSADIFSTFEKFLTKDLTLKTNYTLSETDKGKATLDLVLNTKWFNPTRITGLNDILNVFKQSAFVIKADTAGIESFVKKIASLSDDATTRANADPKAQEVIQTLLAAAQNGDWFNANDKEISFSLEIDQGKVKLNGKALSENEVQNILMYIVFAAASMGM